MPTYKLFLYLYISLLCQNLLFGQHEKITNIDSLVKLDFKELYDRFYETIETNRPNAEVYAKAYLQKGKNLDSVFEMSKGFLCVSQLFLDDYEKQIRYIDSGLNIVKNTRHVKQAALLYSRKGSLTQAKGDYDKALDYYLEGLAHSKNKNVLFYKSILQSKIATLKRKLGKYEEAKLLFKKCLVYRKERMGKRQNDSIPYLLTLCDLVTISRQRKELDSALYYHFQGVEMSKETDIEGLYKLNEGIFHYHKKEYDKAIQIINLGLDKFLKSRYKKEYGDHNLIDAYFFLGKTYNALSKKEIAIRYFKKIDSILSQSNDIISESRPAYSEIIKYYKSLGDKNNQLYYINRLLYNDSIFNSKHKSVSAKLIKEYDTPILLSQKEKLITELKTKNDQSYYGLIVSSIIIFIITSILFFSYRKNKRYQKRFDNLMNATNKEIAIEKHENKIIEEPSSIGIAEEVIEVILKKLNEFEKNNGFLEINMTSAILAKKINTNSKYLTKVIKYYRKKSFSPYINDLRIDFITKQLKIDPKLQNYTIKALATEAGFNSAEVFSKSFFKKTGIYPSYFVKRLLAQEN